MQEQVLFDQAYTFHMAGQLSQAQELYARLLKLNPSHLQTLDLLGIMALQAKQFLKVSGP